METQKNLKAIPADELVVGHQGIYHVPENAVDKMNEEVTATLGAVSQAISITADIPLGRKQEGKVVLSIEKNIKDFVADELAKKDNHLPKTEVGVWVYYLTKGIENDFGRTWEQPPTSIKPSRSKYEVAKSKGKRALSKAEKNEMLAKCDINYYADDIKEGKITIEEAQNSIAEAFAKKLDLENAGYIITKKKTEGIKKFDEITEIKKYWTEDDSKGLLYAQHNYKLVVPHLEDYIDLRGNNSYETQMRKITFVNWTRVHDKKSLLKEISDYVSNKPGMKDIFTSRTLKGIHICKLGIMGQQKQRFIVIDMKDNKDGSQVLLNISSDGNNAIELSD